MQKKKKIKKKNKKNWERVFVFEITASELFVLSRLFYADNSCYQQ